MRERLKHLDCSRELQTHLPAMSSGPEEENSTVEISCSGMMQTSLLLECPISEMLLQQLGDEETTLCL